MMKPFMQRYCCNPFHALAPFYTLWKLQKKVFWWFLEVKKQTKGMKHVDSLVLVDTVLKHQKAHACNDFQYNPSSNSTCDVREVTVKIN